jgi:DnaD/phage-associated family protein
MDWIKLKTKHVLNNNFTLLELGALVKMQILTAHLERIPLDDEMRAEVTDKVREAVERRLQAQRTSLAQVLHKVCEDVAQVTHARCEASARKKKQRNNTENKPLSHVTPPLQRREEEIRGKKIIEDDTELRYYTDNIHPLTPNLISEIQSYYVDTDKDWLIQAMDEAVRNNKKTWAYIETIIKAWKLKGKVSKEKKKDGTYEERLAAAKKHEREYEEKLIREENYVK